MSLYATDSNGKLHKIAGNGIGDTVVVDAQLDPESTNPVQNKVITSALNRLIEDISETDLSDYYTKGEVDNKIDNIPVPDLSDYYTKNETDDNINNNVNVKFAESERLKSKNLFNTLAIHSQDKFVNNGDGTLSLVDLIFYYEELDVTNYLKLELGKTYIYSFVLNELSTDTYTSTELIIYFEDSSYFTAVNIGHGVSSVGSRWASSPFTVPSDRGKITSIKWRPLRKNNNTSTLNGTISNIQIEEGSIATDYQSYDGGQIAHFGDIIGMNWVVLWENSNKTANFPSQTVTLSNKFSNFDYLKLEYAQVVPTNEVVNCRQFIDFIPFVNGDLEILCGTYYGTERYLKSRTLKCVNETQIRFDGAFQEGSSNDRMVVPMRIYGIKNGV